MVKQETRGIRMWLECAVRSDCASWSLDLSHGALLPCGAGGMECRAWTPPLDLLGWGRAALHAHVAEQPSAIHSSHSYLMLVPLVSLAWVDSEVILSFCGDVDVSLYEIPLHRWGQGLHISVLMRKKASHMCPHSLVQGSGLVAPHLHWESESRCGSLSKSQIREDHRWLVEHQGWP